MTIPTLTQRVIVKETEDDSDSESNQASCSSSGSEKDNSEVESRSHAEGGDSDDGPIKQNAAWADSIARILNSNKGKRKSTLTLSKAKKITDLKRTIQKTPTGFEIETQDGKIKKEEIEEKIQLDVKSKQPARKKRKELRSRSLRVKPDILERDRERTLSKIATRGVVQLFNAVKSQQADLTKKLKEAGPLEVRKDKVLKSFDKRTFLDVLMGDKSLNSSNNHETQTVKRELNQPIVQKKMIVDDKNSSSGTWNVLRDDFMMSSKMKDWDKEVEVEENEEIEDVNMESE